MAQTNAQGATATTEAAGAHAFPPFQSDTFPSQLLWLALTFGALWLLMARVVLPGVAATLEARRKAIADRIDEASALQAKADSSAADQERKLADAKAQARASAQKTRDDLAADAQTKRSALEADLSAKLAEAEKRIGAQRDSAMSNVETIARDAAAAVVERVLGRSVDPSSVAAAVSAAGSN